MARIRCFLLVPTGNVRVWLRRYHSPHTLDEDVCQRCGSDGYHDARLQYTDEPEVRNEKNYICNGQKPLPPHDDPNWPVQCACGYIFREEDRWQRFVEQLFRRADTGEEMTIADAPDGAMWYAPWMDQFQVPQDGHNLIVKTPGGEWDIDSQSRNCAMPEDRRQEKHHCWIRIGEPPNVTVGKDGPTCAAGAGSIQCGNYHGFLRNGVLED